MKIHGTWYTAFECNVDGAVQNDIRYHLAVQIPFALSLVHQALASRHCQPANVGQLAQSPSEDGFVGPCQAKMHLLDRAALGLRQ